MKVSELFGRLGSTAKSIVRIILQSRRADNVDRPRGGRLVVMANGPSLTGTIAEKRGELKHSDTMSVNFAPLTPEFFDLRPRYHVLADPLFFDFEALPTARDLFDALGRVDWPLTLFLPARSAKLIPETVAANPNITVARFNLVGAKGFHCFENLAYSRGRAMPRPRNVLIPALMCGIRAGYDEIVVVGADHSWTRTLTVADNNRVYSVQPHYYDNGGESTEKPFAGHIDDVLESFMIAFRSYHTVRRYADAAGVRILNATPGSFIDAFDRIIKSKT